jgi:hypothetical protein
MVHRDKHPENVDGCYNCKLLSLRFNGMCALAAQRDYGKTEREITKENIESFRERKGYDPVRADGKDRWI